MPFMRCIGLRLPEWAGRIGEVMNFFRVEELPMQEVLPGVRLRSVNLDKLMMTFVEYEEGSSVPMHHHPHEQITYVLEGFLEVTIGTEKRVLGAGEGVRIAPNTDHSSRPLEGSAKALDAWTPVVKRFASESFSTLGHQVPIEGETPR
jgi:unsaturated pyranuronate lyase